MIDIKILFEAAKAAAKNAGELIEKLEKDRVVISSEGKDIKTVADKESEKLIISSLKKYDISFLSEESGVTIDGMNEFYRWIIDPLDGTYNFTRGYKEFCTSIALWKGDEPVFGVIYHIPKRVLYSGWVGNGAWKDEKKMHKSKPKKKCDSVLATGFPIAFNFSNNEIEEYLDDMQKYKKIRMLGSAAGALAYVAEGVFDAYHEKNILIWDVAAGIAITKALGKSVSYYEICDNKFKVSVN